MREITLTSSKYRVIRGLLFQLPFEGPLRNAGNIFDIQLDRFCTLGDGREFQNTAAMVPRWRVSGPFQGLIFSSCVICFGRKENKAA